MIEDARQASDTPSIKRLIRILKKLIEISEKNYLKVEPHDSLLKGDLIDRITVRYMTKDSGYSGSLKIDRQFFVTAYSSVTLWELKIEIAKRLLLGP